MLAVFKWRDRCYTAIMLIAGVEKLTTLDYPGRLAAVVFTPGCNFKCGYCHNPHLVDPDKIKMTAKDFIPERVFFNFLKTRKGLLDGVCITGGEPTMQPNLLEFALKIKECGFLVKIDTNGASARVLEKLARNKAADYFAMDIKTSLDRYEDIVKSGFVRSEVEKSKKFIQNCGMAYEFRTTVVKGKHNKKIFKEIGEWLKGAENYYIQNFRNKVVLEKNYETMSGFSERELLEIKTLMEKYVKRCGIRA